MNKLYQLHSRRGSNQILSFLADIVTLEKCFDNGCTGRRATDTVFFQCITQFVVIYQFSGCFHGTKQSRFGVRLGRLCPFLGQIGYMRSAFAYGKERQNTFFFTFLRLFLLFFGKDYSPARLQNLLAGCLEFHFVYLSQYRSCGEFAVWIKDCDETACYQVEYPLLHIGQSLRLHTGRDNGMVVGHLRVIEYLFRFQ